MPRRFDGEIGQRMLALIRHEVASIARDPRRAGEHYGSALRTARALARFGWIEKADLDRLSTSAESELLSEINRLQR